MAEIVSAQFMVRRDTGLKWGTKNIVLLVGEPGLNTTNGLVKYGDGITPWNSLPYAGNGQFQPLDSDLTAIAALSTTAFGRSLLELASASALRTAAGLSGGVSGTFANPTSITVSNGIITAIS